MAIGGVRHASHRMPGNLGNHLFGRMAWNRQSLEYGFEFLGRQEINEDARVWIGVQN